MKPTAEHRHDHAAGSHSHGHHHTHEEIPEGVLTSRRDFLRVLMGGALTGASILELAYQRAAWARAAAPMMYGRLFEIQKAADGVYFAHARPQAIENCNASIFVRSKDVVVVDAHSKPSAAASLIAQTRREITPKPVRYVINTHFHWDHTQGDHAYQQPGHKVDFIASATTKQLMSDLATVRLKASVDAVPEQIEVLRRRLEHSRLPAERAFCAEQIRQMQAYVTEMKHYTLELPTITFDTSYLLQDPAYDLHLEFHGHAHTAGDIFIYCPQRGIIATGDVIHGFLPFFADGFPRPWPHTIDSVSRMEFTHILPGHGPLQTGRLVMMGLRNYIEELTEKVEDGKRAGWTVAEMQQRITVASLQSLQADHYEEYLMRVSAEDHPHFGKMPPLQDSVNVNIRDVYNNLDRV